MATTYPFVFKAEGKTETTPSIDSAGYAEARSVELEEISRIKVRESRESFREPLKDPMIPHFRSGLEAP